MTWWLRVVLLTVRLCILAGLVQEPLFEIGDTAVTDQVFLWGAEGLSVAHSSPQVELLSGLQLVTFVVVTGCTIGALFGRRWRSRVIWVAAGSMALCAIAAILRAWGIAHRVGDVIPIFGVLAGPALLVYLFALLVFQGIVEVRLASPVAE